MCKQCTQEFILAALRALGAVGWVRGLFSGLLIVRPLRTEGNLIFTE
jgi:hypothetical protein